MFSCQARLRSASLTIAIAAPVLAAHAQAAPAVVRQDTAGRSFHLRAGGGMDVAADQNTNTANALIGVDWQTARLAVQPESGRRLFSARV